MSRHGRVAGILLLVVLALLATSCTKVVKPSTSGAIPAEVLSAQSAVPAQWGNLISVSGVADYPDLVQLWFEDHEGTVRYAVVSLRFHRLLNAHVIHRS